MPIFKSLTKHLLLAALLITTMHGLSQPLSPVYLTHYTFTEGQEEVAQIRLRDGHKKWKGLSLSGVYAHAFRIDKTRLLLADASALKNIAAATIIIKGRTKQGAFADTVRLLKDQFIRNKVIAHRGAFKTLGTSENSIASLQQAIALGCEGSEFDVHLSADGVPFINHDPKIGEQVIAETSAAVLSAVKLSNGEPFPTLEAYLKSGMQQHKTKLILEIKKSSLGKGSSILLTQKVVAMIESLGAEAWVEYISFDYDVCKEVMRLAPYAKVAYLNGEKTPAELAAEKFYGLDYHFSVLQKHPEWIAEAKQHHLTINVWTVNDEATMKKLLDADVDFITTNEPELLLKLIKEKEPVAGVSMK